jgi:hypothetical protein
VHLGELELCLCAHSGRELCVSYDVAECLSVERDTSEPIS